MAGLVAVAGTLGLSSALTVAYVEQPVVLQLSGSGPIVEGVNTALVGGLVIVIITVATRLVWWALRRYVARHSSSTESSVAG